MKFVVSLVCGRNITTKDCIDIVSKRKNDIKIANIPEISDFPSCERRRVIGSSPVTYWLDYIPSLWKL